MTNQKQNRLKTLLWMLGILVLIPVTHYGLYFLFGRTLTTPTQLIAHRGGLSHAPENTLAAFQHAIDTGVDWLELDVQRTQDGQLVVFHDTTVERTTNGTGSVASLSFADIRALDAGSGEQVPSFEDVITLAKTAGVGLLPELKSAQLYPNIDEQVVAALNQANYADKTVVQSFNHEVLINLKSNHPDINVCPLYALWELNLAKPQPSNAEILCPMAEMVLLNPWMIKQAHDQNKKIYVWFGINEHPFLIRSLRNLGVDGLMVDDTVTLKGMLERP